MYAYKENDFCPICETTLGGKLKKEITTEVFEYKGEKLGIPGYLVFMCDKCGEGFVDEQTISRTEPVIRDFHRRVDGLLTSAEIKALRKKLSWSQEDLAKELGLTRLTISRYETGRLTQNLLQDKYLRMLDMCPELLQSLTKQRTSADFETITMTIPPREEESFNYKVNISGASKVKNYANGEMLYEYAA